MSRRLSIVLLTVACLTGVAIAPVGGVTAQTQGTYELSVSGTIVEFADRTVTIGGEQFTESSIARVQQGDPIRADVNAPAADSSYTVNLYNNEFQVVASTARTGSGTVTFQTGTLAPGSYMVGVLEDGEFRAIQSVVVPGYSVSIDVARGGSDRSAARVTLTVDRTAATTPPHRVQVVAANDETTRFFPAKRTRPGEYRVTIPPAKLEAGTYTVAGAVRGEDTLRDGRAVVLGVSGTETVVIAQRGRSSPPGNAGSVSGPGDAGRPVPGTVADWSSRTVSSERTRAVRPLIA